jgi:hypothetical protein
MINKGISWISVHSRISSCPTDRCHNISFSEARPMPVQAVSFDLSLSVRSFRSHNEKDFMWLKYSGISRTENNFSFWFRPLFLLVDIFTINSGNFLLIPDIYLHTIFKEISCRILINISILFLHKVTDFCSTILFTPLARFLEWFSETQEPNLLHQESLKNMIFIQLLYRFVALFKAIIYEPA